MKKVTIKDIAREVGVSPGTVDRILHNRGRYSPETEAQVRSAMKDLNYKPNILARTLSLATAGVFAVVVPYPSQDSGYWEWPVRGIGQAVDDLQHWNIQTAFFHFNRNSRSSFVDALRLALESRPAGLILAPVPDVGEEFMAEPYLREIPVILIDTLIRRGEYLCYIGQDSFQSGRLAGKLLSLLVPPEGILFIAGPRRRNLHLDERERGFLDYLSVSNRPAPVRIYMEGSDDREEWRFRLDACRDQFRGGQAGIFCLDASAHYIAEYLAENEISDRVRIVGFDLVDQNRSALEKNRLDFILTQRPEAQGYEAVQRLYRYLYLNEQPPKQIIMPLEIFTSENIPIDGGKKWEIH